MGMMVTLRGYSLEEIALGILMAAVVIGILALYCIRTLKKSKQEMKEIENRIPKEDRDKLMASGFQEYPGSKHRIVGTGIVTDVQKEAKKVKITVLYYNSFFRLYATEKVSVTPECYEQMQPKTGDFVQVLCAKDKDNFLKVKEILQP